MTAELQAIVDLIALERDAILFLSRRGFKVSKPKAKAERKVTAALNAVGKPYGASYDPNYKIKHKVTPAYVGNRGSITSYIKPEQWTQMCALAQRQWDITHKQP